MPTLMRFGAVTIRMYADDHRPPHFHIVGPDFQVLVRISDLAVIVGEARQAQLSEAIRWADQHREMLALKWAGTERAGLTMPRKPIPRIAAVYPADRPLTLRVRWTHGGETLIDVSSLIETFRVYAPLRTAPDLFAKVEVGEHGADVVWSGEIDMAADTLWRLAQEQSGATMTADAFRHWRERKAYTLETAAQALGLSRRMVAYYDRGARPIPRTVALATKALELGA